MPSTEVCNGVDDDCNGAVDELAICSCKVAMFGGNEYRFCANTLNYANASAACQAAGYHLVSIGSAAEDSFVHSNAVAVANVKWWIGLNDIAVEGTFVWTDGTPLIYTNWEPGEPNNAGNEDCGQINRFNPKNTWNDEPCNQALPYVCEKP